MNTPFQALLSDLDGTLVDSEPIHCRAWLDVLAKYELQFDMNWFEQWVGTSDRFLAEAVIREHGIRRKVRELQQEKQIAFHAAILKQGKIFPGVEDHLKVIKEKIPIAIVTNSGRLDAEYAFKATNIDQYAQVSITADDVKQLKPAPESYFKAAASLSVDSKKCIAIEDSSAGTYAAMSAGCYVIGIHHGHLERELHANEVVREPKEAFARLCQLLT